LFSDSEKPHIFIENQPNPIPIPMRFLRCSACLVLFFSLSITAQDRPEVLKKLLNKMEAVSQVAYNTERIIINRANGQDLNYTSGAYFDFTSTDTLIGAKYRFVNPEHGDQVFNGKIEFMAANEQRLVIYDNTPDSRGVSSSIFFNPSFYSIRKIVPILMADTEVNITQKQDTLVSGKAYGNIEFELVDRYIDMGVKISPLSEANQTKVRYTMMIDPGSDLPRFFGNIRNDGQDIDGAFFTDYDLNPTFDPKHWQMDYMPKDFMRLSGKEYSQRMRNQMKSKVGAMAKPWELQDLEGNTVAFPNAKAPLTLLEFWFPYCQGCVLATPVLNAIQKDYANRGLTVFGIEMTDKPNEMLKKYEAEKGVEAKTLVQGKAVAKAYGVQAAPTYFIIDSDGKILFTSIGMKEEELRASIEANLQ
jgi:thiol-disulfide isomerase/thioredoxin